MHLERTVQAQEPLEATTLGERKAAAILQPSYLPWLGYFAQAYHTDAFILYDDVQYDKHGWRNRNRIKTPNGPQWLTVPVLTRGKERPLIRDVEITNTERWQHKHLSSLKQNYAKAAHFEACFEVLEALLGRPWKYLVDLNVACFRALNELLGLHRPTFLASDFDVSGDRIERLIALCRAVGANAFYEGQAGQDYIDDQRFADAGIAITYQQYNHPTYPQLHGDFVPYLSVVDLLFNCGPGSLDILAV